MSALDFIVTRYYSGITEAMIWSAKIACHWEASPYNLACEHRRLSHSNELYKKIEEWLYVFLSRAGLFKGKVIFVYQNI